MKIGNWVEEQILYEYRKKYNLPYEEENTATALKDFRVDNRDLYHSSNREYGLSPEEKAKFYKESLKPESFKTRTSEIPTMGPEEKLQDMHASHQIFPQMKNDMQTTNQINF